MSKIGSLISVHGDSLPNHLLAIRLAQSERWTIWDLRMKLNLKNKRPMKMEDSINDGPICKKTLELTSR